MEMLPCALPAELGERLGVIAARLERIVAAQQELLEQQHSLAHSLHPAEQERRERLVLESYTHALDAVFEKMERRLTIRWLSMTSLFGFIVYITQLFVK
ncbi:MAG: hypothetical protein OEM52_14740 [bacterium]|nr:hypothetical protein [bacterium]